MGLGNLGQKLARIGRDTKHGVQKMSDSVTIRNRISAEKRSLERLFAVIGESVYKGDPDAPKAGLEDEYAAVKVAYANIEKYSKQLDQVNGIVYCPNCGKPADPGDKFCAKCGARLTPEEGTASKVAQDFREAGKEVGKLAGNAADRTGEFFGSAAAKTRNGFTSLKDRGKSLMKDASQKIGRRKSGDPDEEDAGGEQPAETESLPEAGPVPGTPAEQTAAAAEDLKESAAETETAAEESAAEEGPETAAEESAAEEGPETDDGERSGEGD